MTKLSANYRPQIILNHPTLIVRTLHGVGQFAVQIGEHISPDTILGSYMTPAGFSAVDLAKRLGVSTSEATKYLQKPLGSPIYRGELLALKKNLLGETAVTAPTDGLIESYDAVTGELRLKFLPHQVQIPSGVYGIVEHLDQEHSQISIKTYVNQINGVAGSGRQRLGLIKVIRNPSNLTTIKQLTPDMTHNIAVVGASIDRDALVKAVSQGIYGIISGGMNFRSYKPLVNKFDSNVNMQTDVGLSVCIVEGFGPLALGNDIYQLLLKHQDQIAYISGAPPRILLPCATAESLTALSKIALPPADLSTAPDVVEIKDVTVGAKARIVWPPFMANTGKILAIDASPTALESGLSTYLVTIETSTHKLKVPFTNIELI